MKMRLISGLFSILLVLLIIIGPIYLAEKLTTIETGQSNLVPSSSVDTDYIPYIEFNNDTKAQYGSYIGGVISIDSQNLQIESMNYNISGYVDNLAHSSGLITEIVLYMNIDAVFMLENSIQTVTFSADFVQDYTIRQLVFRTLNSQFSSTNSVTLDISDKYLNDETWTINITYPNLVSMANVQTTQNQPYNIFAIYINVDDYTGILNVNTDWEIQPLFYEISSYNNSTNGAFDLTFTTYSVHKVMMGIGGVLIILVGLVASPLPIGEAFDGIFPINNHPQPKRRRKN